MSSDKKLVYFMTGRFQPFTLGHLKLFNEMLIRASERSPDAEAYLFVSYRNPKFNIKNVAEMGKEIEQSNPNLESLKKIAKTSDSILDNPLTTDTRVEFVMHLLKKIYGSSFNGKETKSGSGIFEYTVSQMLDIDSMFKSGDHLTGDTTSAMTDLSRPVTLFLVNSRITGTGGLKPYYYLKTQYGSKYTVKMVTGNDRKTPGYFENQNTPIERNETNAAANSASPAKLSGSKIRALCFLSKNPEHTVSALGNLKTMYYNLLSEDEIKKELVDKINGEIQKYVSEKSKKTAKPKSVKSTTSKAKSATARVNSANSRVKTATSRAKSATSKSTKTIKMAEALSPTRNTRTAAPSSSVSTARRSARARKPVSYAGSDSEEASYGKRKVRRVKSRRKKRTN
jgi:hypothetical protein